MGKNTEIKDEYKKLTMNNLFLRGRNRGLIILFHGEDELIEKYGNELYLNMEPNEIKLITRASDSGVFWLKYAPIYGEISIILKGWIGDEDIKKDPEEYKKCMETYKNIEKIFVRGKIDIIKLMLVREVRENGIFKNLMSENSDIVPWNEVKCTGESDEDILSILKAINRFYAGENKLRLEFNIKEYRSRVRDNGFKTSNRGFVENKKTVGKVKESYDKNILNLVEKLKDRKEKFVMIFEGIDASGKGSAIRKILGNLSPNDFDLYRISKPYEHEKDTHFLKRFIPKIYNNKPIVVLDRSWYGRVLVEKVESLDSDKNIEESFYSIYEFERELHRAGIHLMKFWMNVSDEEQLVRFKKRVYRVNKRWKIEEMDWKNRLKSDLYRESAREMFKRSSFEFSPWIIIDGDNKKNARTAIKREILDYLEKVMN